MSRDRGVLKNKQHKKQSNNTVQVKIDFSWTGISKWYQYYDLEVKCFLIPQFTIYFSIKIF